MSILAERERRIAGTLLLKNTDIDVNQLKNPTMFIPFTVQRDGLGRIISNKHFVSTDMARTRNKLPSVRRLSILPCLESEKAIRCGLDYGKVASTSRQVMKSSENQTESTPRLENIERMFVKDRESIERKQMIKHMGEQRNKLVRNRSNEKICFPAGFYDFNDLSFKFKRTPQFEIKPHKEVKQKKKTEESTELFQSKLRSQSLVNIKKKNQKIDDEKSFLDLPQYTGRNKYINEAMSAEDALQLQEAKRMQKLSIHFVDDFNQCHNLFKEKMKIAKMKAIQIKQKIDKL